MGRQDQNFVTARATGVIAHEEASRIFLRDRLYAVSLRHSAGNVVYGHVIASDGIESTQTIASNSGTITTLPDGVTTNWKGSATQPGSYTMQWDLLLDPDPSISGSIALTNAAASTQTFTLNVSQPIVAATPVQRSSARLRFPSTDANGSSGGTVGAPSGSAIYTSFINSNSVQKSCFRIRIQQVCDDHRRCGCRFPKLLRRATTNALASIMGIQHSFTLTGGDSATMNSTFTITPVPEPGTMAWPLWVRWVWLLFVLAASNTCHLRLRNLGPGAASAPGSFFGGSCAKRHFPSDSCRHCEAASRFLESILRRCSVRCLSGLPRLRTTAATLFRELR